ncbi:MAG: hypothetical protein JW798_03320 [Prolixibacteraceae bacterium]|nr:hypothetical protein [Prolixibacteraceae bacterium]
MLKKNFLCLFFLLSFQYLNAQKVFTTIDSIGKMPVFEGFVGGEILTTAWNGGEGFSLNYIDKLNRLNELFPIHGKARINSPYLSCYVDYSNAILSNDFLNTTTDNFYGPSGYVPNYEFKVGTTIYLFKFKKEQNEYIKLTSEYVNSTQTYVTGFNTMVPHSYWLGIDGGYYERKFPMVYREENTSNRFEKNYYWDSYGISGFFVGLSLREIVAFKMNILTDDLKAYSLKRYRSVEYGIKFIFTKPLPDNPPNFNYFEYSQFGMNLWTSFGGMGLELGILPGRIQDWYFRMTYTIPITIGNIINVNLN